jgi:hypothetical protein
MIKAIADSIHPRRPVSKMMLHKDIRAFPKFMIFEN